MEAAQRRMREHPVVLIVQDTTELDYTQHPPKDARCLNREERLGLYEHVHADERTTLPIEEKESFRWLTGYRLACRLAAECPATQIVSVADREADIYEIFVDAQQQAGPCAEYLIRAKEDRCTPQRDLESGPAAYHKVRDDVSRSKLRTTRAIELCQTPKRAARQAYFRTLKTACRVENIQLETTVRLKRCLAFYKIIARRVLYLTYLNRTCPKLPCTAVFDESEWKSVWRVVTKKPLPNKPPPLSKFMQLLTQRGGYNNRASEAPSEPQPLWSDSAA